MALGVNECIRKIDLQFNLLAAQRCRAGQRCDLVKRARELLGGFLQRRARQRPLAGLAPEPGGLLDQAGLGAVKRQQFRLALGDLGELVLEGFGDAGVNCASRLAQQRAVGRILHQGMIEQISCTRRHALPEQQTGGLETIQCRA
ncbi:MAG: hypothetical protein ACXWJL_02515, partial [Xanthobacteraceae bacterium]